MGAILCPLIQIAAAATSTGAAVCGFLLHILQSHHVRTYVGGTVYCSKYLVLQQYQRELDAAVADKRAVVGAVQAVVRSCVKCVLK